MRVGDVVLKRSIYRGNVRWTFPHRIAGEWDGRIGLYCGPGNRGKAMRRGPGGYLEHWISDTPPFDTTWAGTHVLRFERAGAAHSVEVYWREDWSLAGWYVNLQAPTVVNGRCFDTTDWVLDITVDPDGTWAWKDEDELEQAIGLGVFDEAAAEAVRQEGRRVAESRPWPTGWEDWRPAADWCPLPLPVDWHVV